MILQNLVETLNHYHSLPQVLWILSDYWTHNCYHKTFTIWYVRESLLLPLFRGRVNWDSERLGTSSLPDVRKNEIGIPCKENVLALEDKDLHLKATSHKYWRREWQPTPVFMPEESHGPRSQVGYSPWGRKESDTTERLHFTSLLISISWVSLERSPFLSLS